MPRRCCPTGRRRVSTAAVPAGGVQTCPSAPGGGIPLRQRYGGVPPYLYLLSWTGGPACRWAGLAVLSDHVGSGLCARPRPVVKECEEGFSLPRRLLSVVAVPMGGLRVSTRRTATTPIERGSAEGYSPLPGVAQACPPQAGGVPPSVYLPSWTGGPACRWAGLAVLSDHVGSGLCARPRTVVKECRGRL